MKDLSSLERGRVKIYLVTEDNWFIHIKDNNDIENGIVVDESGEYIRIRTLENIYHKLQI